MYKPFILKVKQQEVRGNNKYKKRKPRALFENITFYTNACVESLKVIIVLLDNKRYLSGYGMCI